MTHIYDTHIKGYAGKFTENTIDRIREMPEVDFVERDQLVEAVEEGVFDRLCGNRTGQLLEASREFCGTIQRFGIAKQAFDDGIDSRFRDLAGGFCVPCDLFEQAAIFVSCR